MGWVDRVGEGVFVIPQHWLDCPEDIGYDRVMIVCQDLLQVC